MPLQVRLPTTWDLGYLGVESPSEQHKRERFLKPVSSSLYTISSTVVLKEARKSRSGQAVSCSLQFAGRLESDP